MAQKLDTFDDALQALDREAKRLYGSSEYIEQVRGEKYRVSWSYLLSLRQYEPKKTEAIRPKRAPKRKAQALGPAVEKLRPKWPKKHKAGNGKK